MRRAIPWLLTVSLLLAGCWNRIEVNDLAVVSLMGVDLAPDNRVQVWLHVVNPARAGDVPGTGGTSTGLRFLTLTATGRSVMEATRFIQTQLPRRIFWAHARVILIGERLARQGARPALDFFTRHREMRPTNYLLVVQGDLGRFMGRPVDLEKLPVEYLREITRSRIGPRVTIGDWVTALADPGADPIAGVARLEPPPEAAATAQNPSIGVAGAALFRDDRLEAFMDPSTTRGLLWLRGEVHPGVVTVEFGGIPVSIELTQTRAQRRAHLEQGRIVITLRVRAEGDLVEDHIALDVSQPAVIRKVEAAVGKEIEQRIRLALETIRRLEVDSAGLGTVVRTQMPSVWAQVQKRWPEEGMQKAEVRIQVDAHIRRTGLLSEPRGIREEERKKGGE
jgi:spore germination protein KC